MKKNIVFNKYYKNLRENIFNDLEIQEFLSIYTKFKRLNTQYKLLQIANGIEKLTIPIIEIPIIYFITKLLDFIRWKIYDLLMFLINGRQFNLFGVTIFCGRQR